MSTYSNGKPRSNIPQTPSGYRFLIGDPCSVKVDGERLAAVVVGLNPLRARVTAADPVWGGSEHPGKRVRVARA